MKKTKKNVDPIEECKEIKRQNKRIKSLEDLAKKYHSLPVYIGFMKIWDGYVNEYGSDAQTDLSNEIEKLLPKVTNIEYRRIQGQHHHPKFEKKLKFFNLKEDYTYSIIFSSRAELRLCATEDYYEEYKFKNKDFEFIVGEFGEIEEDYKDKRGKGTPDCHVIAIKKRKKILLKDNMIAPMKGAGSGPPILSWIFKDTQKTYTQLKKKEEKLK
ncbi:hypothetical protein KY348_05075 [Candidatus Woesearchaeota archaeon]|nr:hypothetical protein [Candidatus Woesearchaeota archaeon]